MTDLVQWLTEQIDLDEAHARKDLWALERSTPGRWEAHYGYNLPYSLLKGEGGVEIARFTAGTVPLPDGADDLHAADILLVVRLVRKARERADRVLRQVAAYRRILAVVSPWGHRYCEDSWYSCGLAVEYGSTEPGSGCSREDQIGTCDCGLEIRRMRILGSLASIYSDRPGFDPSWSVE